mgnify:CR=1 FL=1
MKKIFAIMIAVITCFSICSCDPGSFVVSRDSLDNVISVELIEYANSDQKHFITWVPDQSDKLVPFLLFSFLHIPLWITSADCHQPFSV